MNIGIFFVLLFPLAIVAGILFSIWKFTHVILERYKIAHSKLLAVLVCILFLVLIIFWMDSSLSGTRWFGC